MNPYTASYLSVIIASLAFIGLTFLWAYDKFDEQSRKEGSFFSQWLLRLVVRFEDGSIAYEQEGLSIRQYRMAMKALREAYGRDYTLVEVPPDKYAGYQGKERIRVMRENHDIIFQYVLHEKK